MKMDRREAEELLYAEEPRDLTPDGYLAAISKLRSYDKALANAVERVLKPQLDKDLFTRSVIPWQDESRGTIYRIALLGINPHFLQDVEVVRQVLGILPGQVRSSPDDEVMTSLRKSKFFWDRPDEELEEIADNVLARRWIRQHERVSKGLQLDQFVEGLDPQALSAASESAAIDLSDVAGPLWLRASPTLHASCGWDENLPLHRAASCLLFRHRLPHHACYPMMLYLLTTRKAHLLNIKPHRVRLIHGSGEIDVMPPSNSFSIVLEGLDEYSTKEEWLQVWNDQIVPQQQELREASGQAPRGQRAPKLERLRAGMPLYRAWIELGTPEAALDYLEEQEWSWANTEPETARRVISVLHSLLEPVEEPTAKGKG